MLKRENYINIQAWMVTELELAGNDLLVFAIIHGFSQDGETPFMGTRSYLAEWCHASERSVQRNINNLLAKGLIEQVYHSDDNRQVYYKAVTSDKLSLVTNCHEPSDKMSPVPVTNCHQTSDKMSPVLKDNNIADTINDNLSDSIVVCDTPTPDHFTKPTREAVKTFAERKGPAVVDPERFYDFYEANGWKVGKNKMKDWRAAFRNWERTEKAGKPGGSVDKITYMQNEYSKDHLQQKEADSLAMLDDLLDEGGQ